MTTPTTPLDLDAGDARSLIAAERRRQIEVEGYTSDHDARHDPAEFHRAARAYFWGDRNLWPWGSEFWKPKSHIRNLIRAGALWQAAIDLGDVAHQAKFEHCVVMLQRELDDARTDVPALVEEVKRLREGGRELGRIIERQCRDILDITGLHRMIDDDGDGDWGAVWENAYSLRADRDAAIDRAEAAGTALTGAREDIQFRRREFLRLDADDEYLTGLDDAFGLVSNRLRALTGAPVQTAPHRDLGPVDQAAAFRIVHDLSASERRVARARRWIETCVDPVVVRPERKQAMLDYLDGKRDVPDDIAALTEVQAGEVPSAGEDGAAWFEHDETMPTPAPVDDREALAAVIFANRDRKVEGIADAVLAAGYVKGGQV